MDLLVLLFSLCFPMLGGHDLLDQIPTDVYWKSKGITVTGESMLAQLSAEETTVDAKGLIQQLGDAEFARREAAMQKLITAGPAVAKEVEAAMQSGDPEVAARAKRIARHLQQGQRDGLNRQLMAVRALGELKYEPALPRLKAMAAQGTGDLARYAERAVVLIEASQKPASEVPKLITHNLQLPSAEELAADVNLLPASALGVAQIAFSERVKMPLDPVVNFQPLFGPGLPRAEREPVYFAKLIQLVDEIGNIRIDSATASFSYMEADRVAFVTCVVRGKYDWSSLRPLLLKEGLQSEVIEKQELMRTEGKNEGVILIPLSDSRLLAILGELPKTLPIKEMLAGENSPSLIRKNEKLWKLIQQADGKQPGWAALVAPPEFEKIPWLAGLGTATVEVQQEGSQLNFVMDAQANDPAKIDPTLKDFDKSLEHAQNESEQLATIIPAITPLADIMLSMEYKKLPMGAIFKARTLDVEPLLALPLVLSSGEWMK